MSIGPDYKKKYGLIIPKSREVAPVKKRPLSSVFNVDSDEEDEEDSGPIPIKQINQPSSASFRNMKKQAKIDIQRALEDDPSVYQYDEIFDEMKEDKAKKLGEAKKDKTSKYAKNLIRNAAIRKLENDRHFERQCQRELEDEGDEFADKESFVTSSYKNKLAELAVLEEEHKRMAEEDKRNDVTKKKDLTDFYRNILSQRTETVSTSEAANSASGTTEAGPDENEVKPSGDVSKAKGDSDVNVMKKRNADKSRQYRARPNVEEQETGSEGGSGESDTEEIAEKGHSDEKDSHEKNKDGGGKSSSKKDVEENPDKDDSDSDSSSGDEKEKDDAGDSITPVEKSDDVKELGVSDVAQEKKVLFLSAEEKREMRIKLVKESCKKRNTPETIQAAIERYWKRQNALTT